jgi:hypothetical protein
LHKELIIKISLFSKTATLPDYSKHPTGRKLWIERETNCKVISSITESPSDRI